MILSVLVLNGFQSVKFNYEHFINETTDFSLNSYYFTLNESKIDLDEWQRNIIQTALSIIPKDCKEQPIIFSIDDTMIEKFGTHFENCATLYDHAAHNGSNYLNGHCFVSLLMSVPVKDNSKCKYISFPISYRMWTQEESKLSMSAQMVSEAMQTIGEEYKAILCCDSWYPKGDVLNLVNKFSNLSMICNARSDTVIYDLPPETRKSILQNLAKPGKVFCVAFFQKDAQRKYPWGTDLLQNKMKLEWGRTCCKWFSPHDKLLSFFQKLISVLPKKAVNVVVHANMVKSYPYRILN